jgi:hypothetical protein
MDALTNDLVHDPSSNLPPDDTINSVIALERAEALVKAADAWSQVLEIATAEQAGRAKDAVDQLRAEWLKVDADRKAEKKPHDAAAVAVQKRWNPILQMISACQEPIQALHTRWLRREDERLAKERQEAEARAAIAVKAAEDAARWAEQATLAPVTARIEAAAAAERAEAAVAAAHVIPDRARVQGSYGRPARSLREYWFAEVTDILKAARHYRSRPELIDVLTRLASADARGGARSIPGCEVKSRKE